MFWLGHVYLLASMEKCYWVKCEKSLLTDPHIVMMKAVHIYLYLSLLLTCCMSSRRVHDVNIWERMECAGGPYDIVFHSIDMCVDIIDMQLTDVSLQMCFPTCEKEWSVLLVNMTLCSLESPCVFTWFAACSWLMYHFKCASLHLGKNGVYWWSIKHCVHLNCYVCIDILYTICSTKLTDVSLQKCFTSRHRCKHRRTDFFLSFSRLQVKVWSLGCDYWFMCLTL